MAYSDGSQLIRTSHDLVLETSLNHFESKHEKQKSLLPKNLNIKNYNDSDTDKTNFIKSESETN